MIIHSQAMGSPPRLDVDTSGLRGPLGVNARMLSCLLPDFDQVSVTVVDGAGDLSSLVQAGDLVKQLDQLQYGLGEGPCIDSVRAARSVMAPHVHGDRRWRRYAPAAGELGLRSQVAAPLRWRDGKPLGALNMYSTTNAEIGVSAPGVAEVMAAQVVSVLVGSREIEHLHRALDNRAVIGQATGMVMARLQVDADQAFAYLRRVSMQRNQKLAQVAAELVRTRQLPSLGAHVPKQRR